MRMHSFLLIFQSVLFQITLAYVISIPIQISTSTESGYQPSFTSPPNRSDLHSVGHAISGDNVTVVTKEARVKRFDYEDEHVWPDDDNMDYDLDGEGDEDDLTLVDRIGKHWQTVATRGLFYLVGICMLGLMTCCCCTICCRVCCHSLRQNCVPCAAFMKFISAYYEDPMYTKAKDMAAMFGLKLDYDTFLKIKERYDMGSEGPYNPLGLPHMA